MEAVPYNLQGLKDLLLMAQCQISQVNTFTGPVMMGDTNGSVNSLKL